MFKLLDLEKNEFSKAEGDKDLVGETEEEPILGDGVTVDDERGFCCCGESCFFEAMMSSLMCELLLVLLDDLIMAMLSFAIFLK